MQKIITRLFIGSSVAFGVIGILLVLTTGPTDDGPNIILLKLLFTAVIFILTSFALSIASKYLNKS
ncbi:hypothetical protein KW791_02920 [Candidatus Parcubacteria bacterium]|nr:hypothetical protein [Candidatus Parcubacteria bacterium]